MLELPTSQLKTLQSLCRSGIFTINIIFIFVWRMPSSPDLMKQQRMVLPFYKGTVISIQTATENNAAQISLFTMHDSVLDLNDTGYH